jgi:hypothetical protein
MSGIFHHLMAFVSAATDPFWKYVTLLLHGDGTNGAQNNTFIDSSSNAFTITRNGSATQGTFSPYGPDWSNYFPSNSSLSFNYTSGIALGDTYTIECWINPVDVSQGFLFNMQQSNVGGFATLQFVVDTGNIGAAVRPTNSGTQYFYYAGTIIANTWQHVALVNTAGTAQLYVNGTAVGTTFSFPAMSTTPSVCAIGQRANGFSPSATYYTGYISNLRITTSAVYTGNFTPSTAPLTAITNTKLLTCQSNRFVDNSTNAYSLTVLSTSVQRFSPFSMGSAYSTTVIGGSAYFAGTGNYLSAGTSTTLALGAANFTAELWIYLDSYNASANTIFDWRTAGGAPSNIPVLVLSGTGVPIFYTSIGSGALITGSSAISLATWAHLAIVRNSTTVTMYLNGVSIGSATNSSTLGIETLRINDPQGGFASTGYFSNVRIVKGTAVYTAAFTPPTAPLTAITNTSLLLSAINGGVYDNAMQNNLVTSNTAQISTTQSKFGGASMYFDGSSTTRLTIPAGPNFNFGSGDFTIEAWVYGISWPASAYMVSQANTSDYAPVLAFIASGKPGIAATSASGSWNVNSSGSAPTLSTSTWYFLAWVRYGNEWSVYVNGTKYIVAASTSVTVYSSTNLLSIGGNNTSSSGNLAFTGYIDDMRITKGYARYTANFTPPTAAFPNY